ncbi:MAG: ABC transporter permease [Gammaproteobacteria bacterium]|nr:ABC transporter permease [Gammaproteobacteria bacterium]
MVPGDPVEAMLGEAAAPADRAELRRALGLDLPLPRQALNYFSGLARGDFGSSLYDQRPVAALLAERLPFTLALAAAALVIAVLAGVPLGVLAALRRGGLIDAAATGIASLGIAIPNFWLGPLLILVFAVGLNWLPVSGADGWRSLILPALTLGTSLAAAIARMVRTATLEVMPELFVTAARARGLSGAAVLRRHILPVAALPVVTVIGLQLGSLLAGAVITEVVFSWPGLGELTVTAIKRRDYPVVQAAVLVISCLYIAVNALTDFLYARIDPRIAQARA